MGNVLRLRMKPQTTFLAVMAQVIILLVNYLMRQTHTKAMNQIDGTLIKIRAVPEDGPK